jgi:hypothetical protein
VTGPGTVAYNTTGFQTQGTVSTAGTYSVSVTVTFDDGSQVTESGSFTAG